MAATSTLSSSPPPSAKVSFDLPTATPFPRRTDTMSIAQTFHLARRARGKLSSEASRSDHNLRLLVGHANLLDSLMIHLSEAEAEQERWYQNTVRGNEYDTEEYGSLAADYESDTESESEESEDDEFEESEEVYYEQKRRTVYRAQPQREVAIEVQEVEVAADYDEYEHDGDEYENDDGEDDGMFTLTRTTSHRPPSLCSDESDDEEDDHAPPSPPQPADHHYPMSEKELRTVSYFSPTLHDNDHDSTEVLFADRLLPTMVSTF